MLGERSGVFAGRLMKKGMIAMKKRIDSGVGRIPLAIIRRHVQLARAPLQNVSANAYRRVRLTLTLPQDLRQWSLLERQEKAFIDIGSPRRTGLLVWTTAGLAGADINWDLRLGLPLREGTVDGLFCSHVFEHMDLPGLRLLAKEAHRVLKDNAHLDISVPDAEKYIHACGRGELLEDRDSWWRPADYKSGSVIDQLNYLACKSGEHRMLLDGELLTNVLLEAGYSSVVERPFDDDLDRPEWRPIS